MDGGEAPERRAARARGSRDGGAQRASMRRLAGGLPAHRQTRPVQLLRGLRAHRRFDVQPARQVAEGHRRPAVAPQDRLLELPARFPRLATGSQRLHAPGSGVHRPCRQQESADRPRVSAARRQLPAVGDGPLPAQPALRQRDDRRQAPRTPVADDGCRSRSLHEGHRHLAMGQQRS